MTTDLKQESGVRRENKTFASPITFEAIREPGAYLCHWSGHLLRVPKGATTADRAGRISLVSNEKLYVTRIDGDPEIPLPKARALAKETGVSTAF